jgi:pimeloyl-ACP methyl ester carboxylesterase
MGVKDFGNGRSPARAGACAAVCGRRGVRLDGALARNYLVRREAGSRANLTIAVRGSLTAVGMPGGVARKPSIDLLRGVVRRRSLLPGEFRVRISVNGVKLFFDVEGAQLVPDGAAMRGKPTLLLLHGGPGVDHSTYKPRFSQLSDIAQVVYLDHRGCGRSDRGSAETWNLGQWGDDVRAFCDAVGIERPIVLGTSFGGMVALAYATRHPGHAGKLILISTEAAGGSHIDERIALFERFGGARVGALARRRFGNGELNEALLDEWVRLAFPVYTRRPRDPAFVQRAVLRPDVHIWFMRAGGEGLTFNFFPVLSRIRCPTLVLGGDEDPMIPIACQEELVAALSPGVARFERFARCGHGVLSDEPERAMAVIREFIETDGETRNAEG